MRLYLRMLISVFMEKPLTGNVTNS